MCITHYIQRKQYDYFNGAMIMSNSVKQGHSNLQCILEMTPIIIK